MAAKLGVDPATLMGWALSGIFEEAATGRNVFGRLGPGLTDYNNPVPKIRHMRGI
jgi:hypothetical protein